LKSSNLNRHRNLFRWLLFSAPVFLASIMLITMIAPAEFWNQPNTDHVYRDFDPNLIYTSIARDKSTTGNILITKSSLEITSVTGSESTVHLVTSPLSFTANMSVNVLESSEDSQPLELSIWTPDSNSGVYIDFGPPPNNHIVVRTKVNGLSKNETIIDSYYPGSKYNIELKRDIKGQTIAARISEQDPSPSGNGICRLDWATMPQHDSQIVSRSPMPVQADKNYIFGGTVRFLNGSNTFGFALEWLDRNNNRIRLDDRWQVPDKNHLWAKKEFSVIAPPSASFVNYYFAVAPGVTVDFSDLFLFSGNNTKVNLLPNGNFLQGSSEWRLGNGEPAQITVIQPNNFSHDYEVFADEYPEIFASTRLTLSAHSSSISGSSIVVIDDYSLTLPHERWIANKVSDIRLTILLCILIVSGVLLCSAAVVIWFRKRNKEQKDRAKLHSNAVSENKISVSRSVFFGLGVALLVYLGVNLVLFRIGSSNADLISARVWTYILSHYRIPDLYYLANTVPLAEAWQGGTPLMEAVFPYDPPMAYIFQVIGWTNRLFLSVPKAGFETGVQLEWLVRFFIMLFAAGDAFLIFLILKNQQVSIKWSLTGAALFLFNPAVLFAGSVWGETQSISVFFLLAAIIMTQKYRPFLSWLLLGLAALMRPQMLIPCFLLGIYFLRRYSTRQNVRSFTWSVVALFLILSPLFFSIGPTLGIDVMINAFLLHGVGLNDSWATPVSWNGLSIWPMVTYLLDNQNGLGRIFYNAQIPLLGNISYLQMGTFLSIATIGLAGAIMYFKRLEGLSFNYLTVVAMGTLALFMLKTGTPAYHFVPAIALVLLLRKSMSATEYCVAAGVLSLTTVIASYSVGIYWLGADPLFGIGLFDIANPVVSFIGKIMTWDWFITLGSLANIGLLIWLVIKSVLPKYSGLSSETRAHGV
jgi:hypothetical protein